MAVIEPVNLVLSVPPHPISPFKSLPVMEGSKEMEIPRSRMSPCVNKLSVTVGMVLAVAGDNVSSVRTSGPRLHMCKKSNGIQCLRNSLMALHTQECHRRLRILLTGDNHINP